MRRLLKRHLPDPESLASQRWLAPLGPALRHPRLWHLNRHSVAGGVAVGLFCGLIPGPFQMLGAAFGCLLLRVNLPLALLVTLYTNPFTIVPLYLLAFRLGEALLGPGHGHFTPPPGWDPASLANGLSAFLAWLGGLGRPLLVGLPVLASLLALLGYLLTQLAWRVHLRYRWQHRRTTRQP